MTDVHDQDLELLRQLSEADSSSPPPAGTAITAERLQERLRRQRKRTLAATTAAFLVALSVWTLWSSPAAARTGETIQASIDDELNALSARVDRLLADLAEPLPEVCTDPRQLRFELATARVNGLAALRTQQQSKPTENR